MTTPEMINPDHYKNETSLECIEVMEMVFGKAFTVDFCVGNAWKYIWRWKNKGGQTDLHKATWYINRTYKILNDLHTGDEERIKYLLQNMEEYINRYKIGEIENE